MKIGAPALDEVPPPVDGEPGSRRPSDEQQPGSRRPSEVEAPRSRRSSRAADAENPSPVPSEATAQDGKVVKEESFLEKAKSLGGLGKVTCRFYPIAPVRVFLHPACLVLSALTCLGNVGSLFIPNISAEGTWATWTIGYATVQGTAALFLLMVGDGPKWAYPPFFVAIMIFMCAGYWLAGTALVGAAACYMIFPACFCKKLPRVSFMVGMLAWLLTFQLTLLIILLFMGSIQESVPASARGMVFPVVSWIYSTIGLILMKAAVQTCAPVGTPLNAISVFITVLVSTAEALKLVSLLQSATEEDEFEGVQLMLTAAITALVGDVGKRLLVPQRMQNVVFWGLGLKRRFAISPEMDVVLRSGYTVSYYPAIPAVMCSFAGLVAEAPWARRRLYWISMVAFLVMDLVEDLAVVVAHRMLYPVSSEGFSTTWKALTEPRQHWPNLQLAAYASDISIRRRPSMDEDDLQVPWSRHKFLNDQMIGCLTFAALTAMTTELAMAAVLGRCRLDVAAHLCEHFGVE